MYICVCVCFYIYTHRSLKFSQRRLWRELYSVMWRRTVWYIYIYRRFKGPCCLYYLSVVDWKLLFTNSIIVTSGFSETSLCTYQTTRSHIIQSSSKPCTVTVLSFRRKSKCADVVWACRLLTNGLSLKSPAVVIDPLTLLVSITVIVTPRNQTVTRSYPSCIEAGCQLFTTFFQRIFETFS